MKTKLRIFGLALVSLILVVSLASALIVNSASSDVFMPGEEGRVNIEVENTLSEDLEDISLRLIFTDKPFISADAIELRYAFWPIFQRQLIIKEIRLVKPEILVEKSKYGSFNY